MTPQALNDRGSQTGRAADSYSFAPLAPIGIHLSNRFGSRANNLSHWINPYATREERATGVRSSWADFFDDTFGPWAGWLEGDGVFYSGLYVFEGPFGAVGDYRSYFGMDGVERARITGKPYLVDGFHERCRIYTSSGSKIVAHDGSLEQGRLAADRNTPFAKAELLRIIYEHDQPLIEAGCDIGHDALSGYAAGSLSYDRFVFLKHLGVGQQLEAVAVPASPAEFKGCACFTTYAMFKGLFCTPQNQNAATWKTPLVSSPDFNKLYAEMRVRIEPADFLISDADQSAFVNGTPEQKRAALAVIAAGTRAMTAMNPRVRPLLGSWIVQTCVAMQFPAVSFWEEPK